MYAQNYNNMQTRPRLKEQLRPQEQLPYKTELCNKYSETGFCRYGHKCRFAHGVQELRIDERTAGDSRYKTQLCKNYHGEKTTCPYGKRCHFIHDEFLLKSAELKCSPCLEATKECDYMDQPISFVSVPNSSVVSVPNSTSVTHRYTFPETVNVTVDQPSFSRDPIPLNGNRTESWKILASDAYGNTLTNTNNIENTYSHLSKGFSLEAKPFTPSSSLSVPPTPPMFPKTSPGVSESEARTLEKRSSFFERLTSYAITEVKEQKIRD
jgi:hypothetical protein